MTALSYDSAWRSQPIACRITSSIGVSSAASGEGRMNGTSIPCARASAATSGSSVETTMRVSAREARAASKVYSTSGRPASGARLFRGMPFEFRRAGMSPGFPSVQNVRTF